MDTACVGIKKDNNKLRMDLLPIHALEAIAGAFTAGEKKYSEVNWQKGIRWSRLWAATIRHLLKWWRGENDDLEDNISHLAHAGADIMMLLDYQLLAKHAKNDDRALLVDGFAETPMTSDDIALNKIKGLRYSGLDSVKDEKKDEPITLLDIVSRTLHLNKNQIILDWCPNSFAGVTMWRQLPPNKKRIFSKPLPEGDRCPRDLEDDVEGKCGKCWLRKYHA